MGPRSPTSRCDNPTLSRNSREPLPSQILTPASLSGRDDVLPWINQSNSAMMARWKTRFVVRRGRTRRPFSRSWNFNGLGAKIDNVPVPVLKICQKLKTKYCQLVLVTAYRSGRRSPFSKMSRTSSRYWNSSCDTLGVIVLKLEWIATCLIDFDCVAKRVDVRDLTLRPRQGKVGPSQLSPLRGGVPLNFSRVCR